MDILCFHWSHWRPNQLCQWSLLSISAQRRKTSLVAYIKASSAIWDALECPKHHKGADKYDLNPMESQCLSGVGVEAQDVYTRQAWVSQIWPNVRVWAMKLISWWLISWIKAVNCLDYTSAGCDSNSHLYFKWILPYFHYICADISAQLVEKFLVCYYRK